MPRAAAIAVMFHFTLFGWLLFRCTRRELLDGVWVDQSLPQIRRVSDRTRAGFCLGAEAAALMAALALFVLPLIAFEWLMDPDREDRGFLDRPGWVPALAHATIAFFVVRYGIQNANAFIYFQF